MINTTQVISELVPMKWRYLANSYAYVVSIPTNPLAAKIAFAFQQTPVKWRGSFYFMTGVSVTSQETASSLANVSFIAKG